MRDSNSEIFTWYTSSTKSSNSFSSTSLNWSLKSTRCEKRQLRCECKFSRTTSLKCPWYMWARTLNKSRIIFLTWLSKELGKSLSIREKKREKNTRQRPFNAHSPPSLTEFSWKHRFIVDCFLGVSEYIVYVLGCRQFNSLAPLVYPYVLPGEESAHR